LQPAQLCSCAMGLAFKSVDCAGAQDSAINVSRAPGSIVGLVDHARRSVVAAPSGIEAAIMTAIVVCDASMTSDRPAHCAETTRADAAHMVVGCLSR
jgi:hypothetical protein